MADIKKAPLLETRDLKKYFKVKKNWLHAVDNINITIEEGKTLGVVGESGCGKSTLGRTILRLLEPTSGQVFFNGEDITKLDKHAMKMKRREMQIIFQDPYASINPRMSVSSIIAEPMIVNKMYDNRYDLLKRVRELMDTGDCSVRVYESDSAWYGVTYHEDKEKVQKSLQALKDQGIYPDSLSRG